MKYKIQRNETAQDNRSWQARHATVWLDHPYLDAAHRRLHVFVGNLDDVCFAGISESMATPGTVNLSLARRVESSWKSLMPRLLRAIQVFLNVTEVTTEEVESLSPRKTA